MKLKSTVLLLLLFLCTGIIHAQKVKIKKGVVYLDEVAILKSDSTKTTHSFYDLKGNEIIFIRFYLESQPLDFNYFNIIFLNEKIKVESTDYDHVALGYKQSIINIVEWFLKEKVLTKNGEINPEKLVIFQYKYHEDISNKISFGRTVDCNCDCKDK